MALYSVTLPTAGVPIYDNKRTFIVKAADATAAKAAVVAAAGDGQAAAINAATPVQLDTGSDEIKLAGTLA